MGSLVMVSASGVEISGGGSWDIARCPYTIPDGLRPADDITTGGMSRDVALSTILYVGISGTVYVSNVGGPGSANITRYASLTYIAG